MSASTQKNSTLILAVFLYYSIYLICLASWVFFRDFYQRKFSYTTVDIIYFVMMAVPLMLPVAVWWAKSHVSRFRSKSSTLTALFLGAAWYLIFSLFYYNTQEHLFDPFVQISPPAIEKKSSKPPETSLRILALGGSTTRGVHLSKGESYPSVLQSILRQKLSPRAIEVFNGAAEWYTTKHALINYVTQYQDWNPSVVIVMHGVNDLFRSCVPSEFAVGQYQEGWTHYYGPAARGAMPLTFEQFLGKPILRPWINRFAGRPIDYPAEFYVSREMFEANLRKLVRVIKAQRSIPVLVTEASLYKEQMPTHEIERLWMGRVLCNALSHLIFEEYPSFISLYRGMRQFSQTVRNVAMAEGAMLIDAEAAISKNLKNFYDDVHYTTLGAETLARIISTELLRAGTLKIE